MNNAPRVGDIAMTGFAAYLGTELVEQEVDRVVVRLPYRKELGVGRIHGGAISSLIDIAATAAFWSNPRIAPDAMGATVGFTINFLNLVDGKDLLATGTVRRRGGTLCTGEVTVADDDGKEVAMAVVTYKLTGYAR